MDHDEYLKRRDELYAIRMDSFSSFDKAILSLSTGGLALSITFLEKIGAPFSLFTFILICLVWVSFFIVIICNLASYHFARANMDSKIEDLDRRYKDELMTDQEDISTEPVFWQNRATACCNSGALITFCLGVLFFVIYIINIQNKNFGELQDKHKKEDVMIKQKAMNGKTETPKAIWPQVTPSFRAPVGSATRGATESPKAIDRPTHLGRTESPQAVLRPANPSDSSSGTPKK